MSEKDVLLLIEDMPESANKIRIYTAGLTSFLIVVTHKISALTINLLNL